jgi:hypothetical protein
VTQAFSRGPRRGIQLSLKQHEVEILRNLFSDLLDLLTEDVPTARSKTPEDSWAAQLGLADLDGDAPVEDPRDPALARLFPPAYPDDEAAAAEFRRYTQPDLRDARRKRVAEVIATLDAIPAGGKQRLEDGQAQSWLAALNDLRLVLGTRLDVTQDQDPQETIDPDDPMSGFRAVYYYLNYLQELLLMTIAP